MASDLTQLVSIVFKGSDQASVAIKSIDSSMKGLAQSTTATTGFFKKFSMSGILDLFVGLSMYRGFGAFVRGMSDAVTASIDLQYQMEATGAIMETSAGQVNKMTEAVVGLSVDTGESAVNLAGSLYELSQAGYTGSEALRILELSAQAAIAGMTESTVALNFAIATMNTYGLAIQDISYIFDASFQAVKEGIFSFEQLNAVWGKVSASAQSMGISFEESLGALVQFSKMGFAGGQLAEGATRYINVIKQIADPSKTKVIENLGVAVYDAEGNFRDLVDIVADLDGVLDQVEPKLQTSLIDKIFPEMRARAGFNTMREFVGEWRNSIDAMTNSAGTMKSVFDTMMETQKQTLAVIGTTMMAHFRELSNDILPPLITSLKNLADIFPTIFKASLIASVGALSAALATHLVVLRSIISTNLVLSAGMLVFGLGLFRAASGAKTANKEFLALGAAIMVASTAFKAVHSLFAVSGLVSLPIALAAGALTLITILSDVETAIDSLDDTITTITDHTKEYSKYTETLSSNLKQQGTSADIARDAIEALNKTRMGDILSDLDDLSAKYSETKKEQAFAEKMFSGAGGWIGRVGTVGATFTMGIANLFLRKEKEMQPLVTAKYDLDEGARTLSTAQNDVIELVREMKGYGLTVDEATQTLARFDIVGADATKQLEMMGYNVGEVARVMATIDPNWAKFTAGKGEIETKLATNLISDSSKFFGAISEHANTLDSAGLALNGVAGEWERIGKKWETIQAKWAGVEMYSSILSTVSTLRNQFESELSDKDIERLNNLSNKAFSMFAPLADESLSLLSDIANGVSPENLEATLATIATPIEEGVARAMRSSPTSSMFGGLSPIFNWIAKNAEYLSTTGTTFSNAGGNQWAEPISSWNELAERWAEIQDKWEVMEWQTKLLESANSITDYQKSLDIGSEEWARLETAKGQIFANIFDQANGYLQTISEVVSWLPYLDINALGGAMAGARGYEAPPTTTPRELTEEELRYQFLREQIRKENILGTERIRRSWGYTTRTTYSDQMQPALEALKRMIEAISEKAVNVMTDALPDKISSVFDTLLDRSSALEDAGFKFGKVADNWGTLGDVWGRIQGRWESINLINTLFESYEMLGKYISASAMPNVSGLALSAGKLMEGMFTDIENIFANLQDNFKSENFWEALAKGISNAKIEQTQNFTITLRASTKEGTASIASQMDEIMAYLKQKGVSA